MPAGVGPLSVLAVVGPAGVPARARDRAPEPVDAPPARATPAPAEHEAAAKRLGAERRRLFLLGALLGLLAPLVPYLTGTWEQGWFWLAAAPVPFAARAGLFLVAVHLILSLVLLPLSYYGGYVLPHAFGLSRQTLRAWAVDWLKGTLVTAVVGSLLGGAYLWSVIGTGANWWWVFGLLASVAGLAFTFLLPYVLVPLFFKMRPLGETDARARIVRLVQRAGAPVREVCSLDFSRRTAEANAAVIGFGRSRRVVIADTLLAEFAPAEVDAVVAHELGHHVRGHVQWLLVGNAALVWLGLGLAAALAPAGLPLLSVPSLGYVPGYPVLLAVAELFFLLAAPALNWWSRRLETAADRFALELTGDGTAFAAAMARIGRQNLIERRPPRWSEVLLASHPALERRIQLAERWVAAH